MVYASLIYVVTLHISFVFQFPYTKQLNEEEEEEDLDKVKKGITNLKTIKKVKNPKYQCIIKVAKGCCPMRGPLIDQGTKYSDGYLWLYWSN